MLNKHFIDKFAIYKNLKIMFEGIFIHHQKFMLFAGILLAISILVIVAIILDLWDGVHTARVTKENIHSHKFRITIGKISEYWRFIIIGFLIDCIGCIFDFYLIPFVAVIFGTGLILVEIKSMFEHAKRRKSNTMNLPIILKRIVEAANEKDARDILEKITSILEDKNKDQQQSQIETERS